MSPSRSPRRRGFTLVELLVVIGIIALLISILMPSLTKARQQANAVACLSNLRQIGVANQLFANDHKGYLPRHWDNTGPKRDDTSWGNQFPFLGWAYLTSQEVGSKQLFRCPEDQSDSQWGRWTTADWAGEQTHADDDIPASYRWNMSHYADGDNALKMTDFRDTTRSMIVAEGYSMDEYPEQFLATWSGDTPSRIGKLSYQNAAYNRHGGKSGKDGKSNFLFLDGHAETLTWNDSWAQLGGTDDRPETIWRRLYEPSKYNGGQPLNNLSP